MIRRKNDSRSGNSIGSTSVVGRTTARSLLLSCLLLPTALAQKTMHVLTSSYEGGWIQDGVMFDVQTVATPGTPTDTFSTTPDGVTIFGIDILTPLKSTMCVELYTKYGSFSSSESNPLAWNFLGSFSLTGAGPNSPTSIPLGAFDPIVMKAGETHAFYVTTQNEKMRYTALTDGTMTGDVYASSEVHYEAAARRKDGKGKYRGSGGKDRDQEGHGNNGEGDNDRRRTLQTTSEGTIDDSDYHSYNRALQDSTKDGLTVQILTGVAKNYPFAESWPDRVFNGALLYTLGTDPSTSFLSDAQLQQAGKTQRGAVTCDVEAIPPTPPPTPTPPPSGAPTMPKVPTLSPVKSPTTSPTKGPSSSPTVEPTTLESTIRKVATTLHGGLKQSGLMFDVRVPSVEEGGPVEGVTVIAIEMSTFLEEEICVEVYTKTGTYEGFEEDVIQNDDGSWSSPTWSVLGASTVIGKGEKEPTHLPIGSLDPVYVAPGERQAFYVTMTKAEMRYTEPKYGEESGALFSGSPDGHLELFVGAAVAYPFEETWPDRIFNGAVIYALGEVEDGKYNEVVAGDRERSCPRPTEAPSKGPSVGPTVGPSQGPTGAPVTGAPVVGVVTTAPVTGAPVAAVIITAPVTSAPVAVVTTASPTVNTVVDNSTSTTASTTAASGGTDAVTTTPPTEPEVNPGDVVDSVPITSEPTKSPTFEIETLMPTPAPLSSALLADSCPSTDAAGDSKDVIVPYEYTVITDGSADISMIVMEMEKTLHTSLIDDMCPSTRRKNKARRMLQMVTYQGFNSNPDDEVSTEGCGDDVTVPEGQECFLVTGGVTAVVESDARVKVVKADVGSKVDSILSDSANYEGLGVQEIAYGGSTSGENGPDESVIGGAKGGDQNAPEDGDGNNSNDGLSTTGIIIIAVLAGVLGIVILALVAMNVHKKKRMKRTSSRELFQEFPDEEEHVYGPSGGYEQSFAPLSSGVAPPPPAMPPTRASSRGPWGSSKANPAVILNEQDEISLFSNDKSKRFASGAMMAPDSPGGSRGSKGSSSSKKSVEFVRAGQSFSSRQSNQPEDTVDL